MDNYSYRATTVLAIVDKTGAAMGGDGQVSLGDTIMKTKASKIRKLHSGTILSGFAGTAADAFTLFERFETKVDEYNGNLSRAAVELTKEWRTDKYLHRLEAVLVVADKKQLLVISGNGDIIEPDDGIIGIGSGGPFALAAARALKANTKLSNEEIVRKSLEVAASICIYTNSNIIVETL